MSTETGDLSEAKSTDHEPLLAVEGLKKHFTQSEGFLDQLFGETGTVRAVDGVDFEIGREETLAVVGESGCGKSTLGKALLNLHTPTAGSVRYNGTDLANLPEKEMRPYRRDLQMIFQDPLASLNPRQTVGDIVAAPMEVHGIGEGDDDRRRRVEELLEKVGLSARYVDRYPHQFSGGQQQRIGIARALSVEPDLIIADEPVSALDVSVQAQILNLLRDIQDEMGLSLLFISHDLSVVRTIADRVAVMYLGEFVETAPADELFDSPEHPYTQALLSAVPRIRPDARSDERQLLEGVVPSPMDPPSGCRFHTRCPAVIPPDGWSASQDLFRSAFLFRNRVRSGDIDVENIRIRIDSESGSVPSETVREIIVQEAFPMELEQLPAEAVQDVLDAADALENDNQQRAAEIVTDAFPSPCEQQIPEETRMGPNHIASCHRLDRDAPGNR